MSGRLAYFVAADRFRRDTLERFGIHDRVVDPVASPTTEGPDGRSGIIITSARTGPPCIRGFAVNWVRLQGAAGGAWVGLDGVDRVSSKSLQRDQLHPGSPVKLRDGQSWIVPRVLAWHVGNHVDSPAVYSPTMPTILDIDDEGNVVDGAVVDEYRDITTIALELVASIRMTTPAARIVADAKWYRFAADVLAINYTIGIVETCTVLRLVDTDTARRIIAAAVGLDSHDAAVGEFRRRRG